MSTIALDTIDFTGLWSEIQIVKPTDHQNICEKQQSVKIYTVDEWKIIRRRNERETDLLPSTS